MPNPSRRDYHFFLFLALSLTVHAGVMAILTWWPHRTSLIPSPKTLYLDLTDVPTLEEILPPAPHFAPRPPTLPQEQRVRKPIVKVPIEEIPPRPALAPRLEEIPIPPLTNNRYAEEGPRVQSSTPPSEAGNSGEASVPLPAPYGKVDTSPPTPSRTQLLAAADAAARNTAEKWQEELRSKLEEEGKLRFDRANGILGSFFGRFDEAISTAWKDEKVPPGVFGIGVATITVNRAGLVENVDLVYSTGHQELDEAIKHSIYRAQTNYGYLPKAWPLETATFVFAFASLPMGFVIY